MVRGGVLVDNGAVATPLERAISRFIGGAATLRLETFLPPPEGAGAHVADARDSHDRRAAMSARTTAI